MALEQISKGNWFLNIAKAPFLFFFGLGKFGFLALALTFILIGSITEAVKLKSMQPIMNEFIGRIIGIDNTLNKDTNSLKEKFSIFTLFNVLSSFTLLFYIAWLCKIVISFIVGNESPLGVVLGTIFLIYTYLVFGNFYFKISNPFYALRGSINFILYTLSFIIDKKEVFSNTITKLNVS